MRKILYIYLMIFYPAVCFAQEPGSVAITKTSINMEAYQEKIQKGFGEYAYLYIGLRNNGYKTVSNLTLDISYYTGEGHPILSAVIKDPLYDSIPPGEERKFKIPLDRGAWGNEIWYPYNQQDALDFFIVKVAAIESEADDAQNSQYITQIIKAGWPMNLPIGQTQREGHITKIQPNLVNSEGLAMMDQKVAQNDPIPQWVLDARDRDPVNEFNEQLQT